MKTKVRSNPSATPEVTDAQVEAYIDKHEVSTRLRMHPRTVDVWMRRGLLPYYKIGKVVRFKWSEVEVHFSRQCRVCRELTKSGL